MQNAGISAENEGGKFHQPPGDEQRDPGRNRKTRLTDRFQRGPLRRTAAEQDLPSALPPKLRHGKVPVQRPVFTAANW